MLDVTNDEFGHEFADRDTFRVMLGCLDVERQLAGRHPVNQSLYIWGRTMLPNYILSNLGDRMEMAHSVEGRLPFLDHYVFEEAARMPISMKIRGMTEKYVLREAARGRADRAGLRPAETSIHVAARDDSAERQAVHVSAGHAARLRPRRAWHLRSQESDRDARRDPVDGPGGRGRADALLMWMTSLCLLSERMEL